MRWLVVLACCLAFSGCTREAPQAVSRVVDDYGCGSCHTIPGIAGATGRTGPPLVEYGRQVYVAGVAPNTPEMLTRFILDPQAVDPRSAMPDLRLTRAEASLLASYLGSGP